MTPPQDGVTNGTEGEMHVGAAASRTRDHGGRRGSWPDGTWPDAAGADPIGEGIESPSGAPGTSWRRRAVLATAVVLALAAAVVWLGPARSRPVDVSTQQGSSWAAPDAPSHQVARRWEWAAPPNATLAGIGVLGDLVFALTTPLVSDHDEDLEATVTALRASTGEIAWVTDVAMSRPDGPRSLAVAPTIHVVGAHDAARLARSTPHLPAGHSSGLDATTGKLLWHRDMTLGDAVPLDARLVAAGAQVVERSPQQATTPSPEGSTSPSPVPIPTPSLASSEPSPVPTAPSSDAVEVTPPPLPSIQSAVVDLHTGEDVFTAPGEVVAIPPGWLARTLGDDGITSTMLDSLGQPLATWSSSAWPVITGDLVVTAAVATVTAQDHDGQERWQVTLELPEASPATDQFTQLLALGGGSMLASLHAIGDMGQPISTHLTLIDAAGAVAPVEESTLRGLADVGALVSVKADGAARILCTRGPGFVISPGEEEPPCPADLALLDPDGRVAATATVEGGLRRHLVVDWPLGGVATTPGIVVGEPDAIVLRSWDDLAPLWQIAVDGRIAEDITVATSDRGVAVGIRSSRPSTVTWLS